MAKRYALVMDLRRCIGCHTCTIACKLENNSGDGIKWIQVKTIGGGGMDEPKGRYPNLSMYYRPITCMHCKDAPCIASCPTNSIIRREDGIVVLEEDICNGCQDCILACPYDVIIFNVESGKSEKCNLCSHRIDVGEIPFCAKECVWGAIIFGDINDPNSDASKLIASRKGYVLLPEKGSSPSVHYVGP